MTDRFTQPTAVVYEIDGKQVIVPYEKSPLADAVLDDDAEELDINDEPVASVERASYRQQPRMRRLQWFGTRQVVGDVDGDHIPDQFYARNPDGTIPRNSFIGEPNSRWQDAKHVGWVVAPLAVLALFVAATRGGGTGQRSDAQGPTTQPSVSAELPGWEIPIRDNGQLMQTLVCDVVQVEPVEVAGYTPENVFYSDNRDLFDSIAGKLATSPLDLSSSVRQNIVQYSGGVSDEIRQAVPALGVENLATTNLQLICQ